MRLDPPQTAAELARMIGATARGNTERLVTGLNEINRVGAGDLVYVDHPKYYAKALNSAATTILIDKEVEVPEGKAIIVSSDPCGDYNKLVRHFSPRLGWDGPGPAIGPGTEVHPSAVIGPEVRIGKDCRIMPGVVIYGPAEIGDRVIIHANTVLGADPFYFKKRPTGYDKMVPCGSIVIEDDVEIGALCAIDRGVSADTRIGKGTKLDNHVQVGHDTLIGQHCLICAHVAIAGAVVIEDSATLWGQVGIPSKVRVGKGAIILGQSGLISSVEGGKSYLGSPAMESKQKLREIALTSRLPDLFKKLKD
ncbi:MAG: UDP-3-O-(3-hydroxymyristoyl)glucosamine N-acyltransferase [Flavobacteriales bacterium]|nr:UDP-3-O-(3-hydroxymyristoyl)glucosamine N-acyltransferase [Flavobacteriales bacterium]HRH68432.1 UDP-3-O-(3-hydroxymyristoyl)glucosamine N-acyltransferase [Flavobacteriales bacterium]